MTLKDYLLKMDRLQRAVFAVKVGTTIRHLTNVAYGYRPLDEKVCVAVERESNAEVTRKDLRPHDWHLIWPELVEVCA